MPRIGGLARQDYRGGVTPRRLFLRVGWAFHRALHRTSGGRIGTARPGPSGPGTLFLTTRGRTTGRPRRIGLFYIEEGAAFVVVASNAGAEHDPAWWRNLQADPHATVTVGGRDTPVVARAATHVEAAVLWPRLDAVYGEYAKYRAKTVREIPVVVLVPAPVG
jgi:deazaflavin-dependent oxidoreductase (nitroreductase family)